MRVVTLSMLITLTLTACAGPSASTSTSPTPGTTATTPDAAGPAADDQGAVLAEVGDQKVYEKEFVAMAERRTPADGQTLSTDERKDVLQKLVEEKALYLEAKKKHIDDDPKVQKVMVNTLLREDVYANVRNSDFTEDQLQKYFDDHKDDFVVPAKVQIKRIFIKVGDEHPEADAKKLAQDLYTQVKKDPTKFSDVASEKSEDPYRRRGGDLGFVGKDGKPGIDPSVIDKAFGMSQGDISEPFEAGGGYNIIQVANKRDQVDRTFEQMRGSVLRKVKNDKYKEMYDKYLADVLKNYTVNIHEDALASVKIEPAKRMPMPGGMGADGAPGMPDAGGDEPGEEMGGMPMPGGPGMPAIPGSAHPGLVAPPGAPGGPHPPGIPKPPPAPGSH